MRAPAFFTVSMLLLFSCQKERTEPEHELQLQSNVELTAASYTLTIDNVPQTDLNAVYKLKKDDVVYWKLERDTATVWLNATIYVDGKAVKYDAGYKDLQLDWIVQ